MDFNEFKEQFTEDVKQELADAGIDAKVSINTVEKMNESYERQSEKEAGIEAEATEKGSVLDELKAKKEEVAQQPKKEAVEKAVKSKGSKGEEL